MTARRIVNEKPGEFTDTDDHVSLLTRDGEMNLNLLPVHKTQQGWCLFDGRLLENLGDEERGEALNINTVSVPNTWRGWLKELPSDDSLDGLILLPMTPEADEWVANLDRCRLSYSEDLGLRLYREA
jgi:CRISPR-associated endonuclease/helicase Cas3